MSTVLRHFFCWLSLVVFAGLGIAAQWANYGQVFHDGAVFFLDGDCYSRMTRVRQVLEKPWEPVRFHAFENAPAGVTPHTTAPMDWIIALLAKALGSLDLAGAVVSPLLGAVLLVFFWAWGYRRGLPFWNATLLIAGLSPILVHGFSLGRPDHQSLILLLVGVGLCAELSLWTKPGKTWGVVSAAAWALALWTSLFEPLILLAAVLACRFLVLGRTAFSFRNKTAAGVFAGILAGALLFDGWRFQPSGDGGEAFFRWAQTIGELNHPTLRQILPWTGWLLPIVPVLLLMRFAREKSRLCLALALLVILTAGLTFWYARWGYFLVLVFALSLPWALAAAPWRPLVWAVFLASLWPMAAEWDRKLFPDAAAEHALAERREDAALLRETALFLKDAPPGVVLAPWWLSPPLAYWSGRNCVSGSSHQSLPGTVDAARFYLATNSLEAKEILARRQVRWVIAYEPSRVIGNSIQVLGTRPAKPPLAQALYTQAPSEDSFLQPAYQNKFFKVFAVKPKP
jgi:hypothetical protein